ncbi:MAG: hypothetical protein LBO69_02925 [Ignavibacteria bacterium]|jgi:hypothetical protein|nr:hypothetical protein [Ignavibacteria bacterium]
MKFTKVTLAAIAAVFAIFCISSQYGFADNPAGVVGEKLKQTASHPNYNGGRLQYIYWQPEPVNITTFYDPEICGRLLVKGALTTEILTIKNANGSVWTGVNRGIIEVNSDGYITYISASPAYPTGNDSLYSIKIQATNILQVQCNVNADCEVFELTGEKVSSGRISGNSTLQTVPGEYSMNKPYAIMLKSGNEIIRYEIVIFNTNNQSINAK